MDYAQLLDIPIQRVEAYKKAIEIYINNLKKKGKKNENKNNDIKESIASAYASIVSLYMTTDLCDDPNAESICENSIIEALKYCPESIEALLQLSNLRIIRKRDNEAKEAMFKILQKIKKVDIGENIEQSLPERDILINLSQNFAELKLFKEACYVINLLIKIDDEDIESYYLLAVYEDNNRNFFSSMEALDKFNNIYMKLQKNGETISPILQQYVDSAKALYNKLSKIKKDKLIDENPEEDDEDERSEAPEEVHEVVFSLTVLYLALKVLKSLLLANKVLELVGRWDLHHDIRPSTLVNLLFLEDIAYVSRLDIHLQSPLLLVDDDSRGIALLHITLELAVCGITRGAARKQGTVAAHEQIAQGDGNDEINPRETYLRARLLVLLILICFLVVAHNQSRLGML